MISESYPWKRDLLRDADIVERWAQKRTESEYRTIILEKKIFLSAYVIRKLIENFKLTDVIKERAIPCRLFSATGSEVDFMNSYQLERHYDLSSECYSRIGISALANQTIHSLVFTFEVQSDRYSAPITGFLVSSDREKNKRLYGVALRDYLLAMRVIGNDWVREFHAIRSEDGWKMSLR